MRFLRQQTTDALAYAREAIARAVDDVVECACVSIVVDDDNKHIDDDQFATAQRYNATTIVESTDRCVDVKQQIRSFICCWFSFRTHLLPRFFQSMSSTRRDAVCTRIRHRRIIAAIIIITNIIVVVGVSVRRGGRRGSRVRSAHR
jgi:hypothetical protein